MAPVIGQSDMWELRGSIGVVEAETWIEGSLRVEREKGNDETALMRDLAARNARRPYDPISIGQVTGGNLKADALRSSHSWTSLRRTRGMDDAVIGSVVLFDERSASV